MPEPVLCYVESPWAFFTTQKLEDQWGDDWNDIPYEHNAGTPYTPIPERGESWEIIKVAYDDADLLTPDYGSWGNSPWSVEAINARQIPWLRTYQFGTAIFAGTTLSEFKRIIGSIGGEVYVREEVPVALR